MGTTVRPMREADLSEARRILRLAFGTFIGAPDPENFRADCDYVATRFRANPHAALVAEAEGMVAGSNFATCWGSFASFGPLTVHPERWNQGIAQALLDATTDLFGAWNVKAAGLFTFAHSPKPEIRFLARFSQCHDVQDAPRSAWRRGVEIFRGRLCRP